jgi:hypothetical protein
VGSEFQVNTYTENAQGVASVAMNATGNFVIAWQSMYQDGSGTGVFAQRYDSSGNKVGSEFQVNSHTDDGQYNPKVAMDLDGNFVITWTSNNQVSYADVFAQRYGSSGNKVGSEFQVNTYTYFLQDLSSVAMDLDGNFVITWQSRTQDGDSRGVFMEFYKLPQIVIKPDTSRTTDEVPTINTKGNGVVPVAILGNASFDIETVNVTNALPKFGPDGAEPIHDLSIPEVYADHLQDVNGDGYLDLVMHFKVKDTGIEPGDTEACLTFAVDSAEILPLCHGIRAL